MQQYTCPTCGSHDLFARRALFDGKPLGFWVLACRNDHTYAGTTGEVIHITGESSPT